MKAGNIKIIRPITRFEKIDSVLIKNPDVTLETIGFYCKLVALSDDFELNINNITSYLNISKDKTRKLISNLEDVGYVRRVKSRNEQGKFIGWDYMIYPTPYEDNTDLLFDNSSRDVDFPIIGKSEIGSISTSGFRNKEKENKQEKEKISPIPPLIKEKEINKEKEIFVELNKFHPSNSACTRAREENGEKEASMSEHIPYQEILTMWNTICTSYPAIRMVTADRKKKIKCRIEEMGGVNIAMDTLRMLFTELQQNDFLKGINRHGWRASFDWIFFNGKNWVKVLEGNYKNGQILNERDYEQQRRREEAMQLTARYIEESKRELAERNKLRND